MHNNNYKIDFNSYKRRQYFTLYVVVSTSPLLGRFPFSCFPVGSLLLTPTSLLYTPKSLPKCFLHVVLRTVHKWGAGSHGFCGGFPGLIHVFNQTGGLTFQPNSRFRIPSHIPFPQGTAESSSSNHS